MLRLQEHLNDLPAQCRVASHTSLHLDHIGLSIAQ